MVEAVRIFVRYEMPDKDDQTRRMRNERVGEATPEFVIPPSGDYLWGIFQRLNQSVSRVSDGVYRLIPPTEYESWCRLTRTLVYPVEYDILCAMDRVFCDEANKELEDIRARERDEITKKKG